MKKKYKIVLLIIGFLVLIIAVGIIIGINTDTKSEKLTIDAGQTGYIEIRHHNDTSEITNEEVILGIVKELNSLTIKKNKGIESNKLYSGEKNSYKVDFYVDKSSKEKKYSISVVSDEKLRVYDNWYKIENKVQLYEYLNDIVSYCKKSLPEETEINVYRFNAYGIEHADKSVIISEYNQMLNAKPIKDTEMHISEKYIEMETYDDDKITLYYEQECTYIKYEYGNKVTFFKYIKY